MLKHIKKQLLIKKNHIIYLIGFLIFIMILSPPIKASDDILHYGLDVNINIDDKKIVEIEYKKFKKDIKKLLYKYDYIMKNKDLYKIYISVEIDGNGFINTNQNIGL